MMELVERVARIIASAMGDNYSDAFRNKDRWIAKRGMSGGRFRDINEPMQDDYLSAAQAAIAAMQPAPAGSEPVAIDGPLYSQRQRVETMGYASFTAALDDLERLRSADARAEVEREFITYLDKQRDEAKAASQSVAAYWIIYIKRAIEAGEHRHDRA